MESEEIKAISTVKSSKNKAKIIICLNEDLKIPSEISKETGIRLNHISNLLADLKDTGIVKCLNEKDKKGRLYTLTDIGEKVVEYCERD